MLFKVSLVVFLFSLALWLLFGFPLTNIIAGIAAAVAGVSLLVEGYAVKN